MTGCLTLLPLNWWVKTSYFSRCDECSTTTRKYECVKQVPSDIFNIFPGVTISQRQLENTNVCMCLDVCRSSCTLIISSFSSSHPLCSGQMTSTRLPCLRGRLYDAFFPKLSREECGSPDDAANPCYAENVVMCTYAGCIVARVVLSLTVLFARSIVSCSGCYSGEGLSVVRVLWRDYYISSLTRPKDLTASHLSRQVDPFASEMTIASSSVFFMWIPLSLRPNFIHRFIVVSAMSQFCPLYNGK